MEEGSGTAVGLSSDDNSGSNGVNNTSTGRNSNRSDHDERSFMDSMARVFEVLHLEEIIFGTMVTILSFLKVHLGDGTMRAIAGERLSCTSPPSARQWKSISLPRWTSYLEGNEAPAHPPNLAPEKNWVLIGRMDAGIAEMQKFETPLLENYVVVFREGVMMPTRELLRVVNNAHAVLVLRGTEEYYYLDRDFVLSTDEEDLVVEWGVGRPLFCNSFVAVAGALLVTFAEQVWRPAVAGTLLVAVARYRVQGVMTKVFRIRSVAWSRHQLVPSRMHGLEQVLQFVNVTLVALADLLGNRTLMLVALLLASVHVVTVECVGQALLTWGVSEYKKALFSQGLKWAILSPICLIFSLYYVSLFPAANGFAVLYIGVCCCVALGAKLSRVALDGCLLFSYSWAGLALGYALCAVVDFHVVLDVIHEAPYLFRTPWKLPSLRVSGFFYFMLRTLGGVAGGLFLSFVTMYTIVQVLSVRVNSDSPSTRGTRTRARESDRVFEHFNVSAIPSRNLLQP